MKRIILIFLAAAIFTFALVVVLNQFDESLKSEAARILDKHPTANSTQQQAYKFLEEHYAEFKAASDPDCGEKTCSSKTFKERPQLRELLTQQKTAIEDYIKLIEFGTIAPEFTATPEKPLREIMMAPFNMHKLFLLQLATWREKGGGVRVVDLIESSNRFMKKVMENGSLLERMIAVVQMKRNGEFLVQELEVQPSFKKLLTPELIESFSTPQAHDIMSGAIEEEMKVLGAFLHSTSRDRFDLELETADWWEASTLYLQKALNVNLFLQPNATINEYYTLASESLATDCTIIEAESEYKCLPSWTKLKPKWPWQKLINPTGRYYVRLVGAGYVGRKQKLQQVLPQIYELRKALSL